MQRLGVALRENSKLKKQVGDLSRQVAVLIKEVEVARFGGSLTVEEMEAEAAKHVTDHGSDHVTTRAMADADSVISKRLVVFRSELLSTQFHNVCFFVFLGSKSLNCLETVAFWTL